MSKRWFHNAGINGQDVKIKTRLFDVDKKQLIGEFDSRTEAADFIGVQTGTVSNAYKHRGIIKSKTNKLGIRIAVR